MKLAGSFEPPVLGQFRWVYHILALILFGLSPPIPRPGCLAEFLWVPGQVKLSQPEAIREVHWKIQHSKDEGPGGNSQSLLAGVVTRRMGDRDLTSFPSRAYYSKMLTIFMNNHILYAVYFFTEIDMMIISAEICDPYLKAKKSN